MSTASTNSLNHSFLWCGYYLSKDEKSLHLDRICESYELFFVTSGSLYLSENGNDYQLETGDYLITSPYSRQYGWKSSSCSYYWFHFNTDDVVVNPHGHYTNFELIDQYYQLLFAHNYQADTGGYLMAALLLELSTQALAKQKTVLSDVFHDVKQYIEYTQPNELSVVKIAKRFGYHPRYLSQEFKKEAGLSLKRYITHIQIKRAKHLLTTTSLTITEIGRYLGYPDIHSFSNFIKKEIGVSPREYRKNSTPS